MKTSIIFYFCKKIEKLKTIVLKYKLINQSKMDKFIKRFPNRSGFVQGLLSFHFPRSQYLEEVKSRITDIWGLWSIALDEEREGWCVSAKDCEYTGGKSWYKKAIQDNGLENLSKVNNNTTFSDGDKNYEIINQMKEARTNLLFQISDFEEALFKMVSATIAYNKLPVFEQSDYHPIYLENIDATRTIKKIANEVDQKLYEFTEDPRVLESYSLYLPLLSMLGIQVTVVKEPEPVESPETLHQDKILVHEQIAKMQGQIAILQQQLAELLLLV